MNSLYWDPMTFSIRNKPIAMKPIRTSFWGRKLLSNLCFLLLISGLGMAHASAIESGHSALWFDPERSGEGLVLEMLSEDHALVYWYTYDDQGNQRWLQGIGAVASDEQGEFLDVSELYITRGGRFGSDFDPDEVEIEIVGEAVMRFSDCNHGSFSYSAFDQSQVIEIQRLTKTMAAGCAPIHGVPGEPIRDYAGQSGTWFDPARDGEGFSMHWLSRDEALVTWYTYDDEGNQRWMVGNGLFVDGKIEFSMIHTTQGGRFGTSFDPNDVELVEWGSLSMDLACLDGSAEFNSDLPAFGSGSLDLNRLTILDQPGCPWAPPKLWDLYDIDLVIVDEVTTNIQPAAVSDSGHVVARYVTPDDVVAARRGPDDDEWELLQSGNVEFSSLVGLSPDGSRLAASTRIGDNRLYRPAFWDSINQWQELPEGIFDSSLVTVASRDLSQLAGRGRNDGDFADYPWVWDEEGGQRELPEAEGIFWADVRGVSNDGETVIGFTIRPWPGGAIPHRTVAIRWIQGNETHFIPDYLGAELGAAVACNADCSVITGMEQAEYDPDHPHFREAWVWRADGPMTYLGALPNSVPDADNIAPATPLDINGDGTIVVGSHLVLNTGNELGTRGFIWTQNTGMISILELFQELGLGDNNWHSMAARAISSDGSKILIGGVHRQGLGIPTEYRVMVLTLSKKG